MFRYFICAAVSVLLHTILLSQPVAKPITLNMTESPNQSIQLQFVSAPATPKITEPIKEKQVIEKKEVVKTPKAAKPKKVIAKKPIPKKPPLKEVAKKKVEAKKKEAPKEIAKVTKKEVNKVDSREKYLPVTKTHTDVKQTANTPVFIEQPKFKFRPTPPNYPRQAKRRGQQGTVLIEVWLNEKGKQLKQFIVKSSGYELLDKAAMKAIKEWQFQGHQVNGKSIASRLKVPVKFELN